MGRQRRNRLIEVVGRLAAPAEVQINYLDQHGFGPLADELALEFDDAALVVDQLHRDGTISETARLAIQALDRKLDSFSGEALEHLWTFEALRSAPEWKAVRGLARRCVSLLVVESDD